MQAANKANIFYKKHPQSRGEQQNIHFDGNCQGKEEAA